MNIVRECSEWLFEVREVFPKLNNKAITAEYKSLGEKTLGRVKAKIKKGPSESEAKDLLLGKKSNLANKIITPDIFEIELNQKLQKIKNMALRKQIIQHILIHELLHIENRDLITLSKNYSRRKKKKNNILFPSNFFSLKNL